MRRELFFYNTFHLRMKEECHRDDDVRGEELHTFEPVAFAVGDHKVDYEDREDDRD